MNAAVPFLLAGFWDDLAKVVLPLLVLLIWVISQIADAKKKLANQPRPPAIPPPGPAELPGVAPAPPAADPLRAQVDEFLRRAGRQGPPPEVEVRGPQPVAAGRDEIEVLLAEEPPAEPARPALGEPLRPMGEVAAASPPKPSRPAAPRPQRRPMPPRPQSVADHVAAHVDAAVEQIRQEVSHLGQAVIAADREFDVQLQHKFDHELGTLGPRRAARQKEQQPSAAASSPAAQIAAMLASPEGVRQAIVVNEILRRPEERW